MNKPELLDNRRKLYLTLTKLYFAELHKGSSLEALNSLKEKIDILIREINDLERAPGITGDPSE
jgi:hypothetical protein